MSIQNALFTLSVKTVKLLYGLAQPRHNINDSFIISYKQMKVFLFISVIFRFVVKILKS